MDKLSRLRGSAFDDEETEEAVCAIGVSAKCSHRTNSRRTNTPSPYIPRIIYPCFHIVSIHVYIHVRAESYILPSTLTLLFGPSIITTQARLRVHPSTVDPSCGLRPASSLSFAVLKLLSLNSSLCCTQ